MKAEWTNKDSLSIESTWQKEILVIDVPTLDDGRHLCNECPIWNNEHLFCQYDFNMKVKGCPLRPLPQRKLEWNWGSGARDWNACLDAITGEKE